MSLTIENTAVKRINELRQKQNQDGLMLRLRVDGGGCSGFQYHMELTDKIDDKDQVFDNCVVVDDISLTFLKDSVISFDKALIGSEFKINNPNAVAGCGCGTSFSVQ